MKSQPMVSTLDTIALLECLKSHHIADAEILAETGVSSSILNTPDFSIPLANLIQLWQKTATVTGDPAIAIHLRQHHGNHFIHFINHMAINSRTVRESFQHYTRYGKLMGNAFSYKLRQEDDLTAFVFSITSALHQNPWIPEYHLSLTRYLAEMLGFQEATLKEVRFIHPCRGNPQVYADFFKAPVLFNQAENALLIPDDIMDFEISGFDAHLQTMLKKQAERILAKLPPENEFLNRIEQIIFQNLGAGTLDIELVAKEMNMHRSTLHRKLKESGTSFVRFLTTIRKRLASLYLDQGMNIDQIAFLLGYSSRSNFQVAFKAWFGLPPAAYKKQGK